MIAGPVAGPRDVYTAPLPRRSSGGPKFVADMAKRGHSLPTYSYALNNPLHFIDKNGLMPDSNYDRTYPEWNPNYQSHQVDAQCWAQCMNETFDNFEPHSVGDATAAACVGGLGSSLVSEFAQLIGVHYGGAAGLSAAGGGILGLRAAGIGGAATALGFGVACSMSCTK